MQFRELLNTERKSFCTGCSACTSICPTGALSLKQDNDGFYVAVYDNSKCINCNKCDKICPTYHYNDAEVIHTNDSCLAVQMNDEIRSISSSGGVFYGISYQLISRFNAKIYGARWEQRTLIHDSCESINDLKNLCGSKYVQSYLADTFVDIKKDLINGRTVLFCGCPCQVAGLYSFLGNRFDNLYTIDLLCFYTPSIKMFNDYLSETYEGEFINCRFRDKKLGWTCERMSLEYKIDSTVKTIICDRENDIYEKAYHERILISEHCSNCVYNTKERFGDITVGDFWSIDRIDPSFKDGLGTSFVMINTKNGQRMIDMSFENIKRIKEVDFKSIIGNRVGYNNLPRSIANRRFYELYESGKTFTRSVEYALHNKYDIALVGCWDIKNYGSQLTYYSLYHILKKNGYSVALIGCHKKARYKSVGSPELFKYNPYDDFSIIEQFSNKEEMIEANGIADSFLLGSDQVWKNSLYKHFGEFTLFDYVFTNKRKIAYGASFGSSSWQGNEIERSFFEYCLSRFNKISVRETSGIDICKKLFNVSAEWVVDPIFLLGKEELKNISQKSSITLDKKIVFAYILDYSSEKEKYIKEVCAILNCQPIILTDPNLPINHNWSIKPHIDYSVEDWIFLIENSEYVITDSFHGMCVSLLLNKNLTIIRNENRGAARFDDYSKEFSLQNYIVHEKELSSCKKISNVDYCLLNRRIEDAVEKSKMWLINSLHVSIDYELDTYDYVKICDYNQRHNTAIFRLRSKTYLKKIKEKGIVGIFKSVMRKTVCKIIRTR